MTGEESVKEQRVEDQSCGFGQDYERGNTEDSDDKMAEIQAEWILLLRSLSLDASSQFEDTQTEVILIKRQCLNHPYDLRRLKSFYKLKSGEVED